MSLETEQISKQTTKRASKAKTTKKASKAKTTKKASKAKTTKKASKAKTTKKRTRKSKSTPVVEESAATPVVEESAATPVVEESTPEPVVEESTPEPVVEESAATPVVEESAATPVVEESAATPVVQVEETINHAELLINSLTELNLNISHLYSHIRNISDSKQFTKVYRQLKNAKRSFNKFEDELSTQAVRSILDAERRGSVKKQRRKSTNPNGGLNKKRDITPELCSFLGYPEGDQASRVDAIRAASKYVDDNNLQIPENKRTFTVDEQLKTIFPEFDIMKYTQIMGGLTKHFLKNT